MDSRLPLASRKSEVSPTRCEVPGDTVLMIMYRPIVALVAGAFAPPGRIMGHAGAFVLPGEADAVEKIKALTEAGATIINHPEKFGGALKARLNESKDKLPPQDRSTGPFTTGSQRRSLHTAVRRASITRRRRISGKSQQRHIYLTQDKSFDLLRSKGINAGEYSGRGTCRFLAIGTDRTSKSPCIIASPSCQPPVLHTMIKRFPFDYEAGVDGLRINRIADYLQVSLRCVDSLRTVIKQLAVLFYEKEAFYLETYIVDRLSEIKVVHAKFGFDDAAFRSMGRQADIQALRDIALEEPSETEAGKDGIVYVTLAGEGNIGTLVNGAGLAMNTVDALADAGGVAANFLDTGGKATSETVKKSFEVILRDPRVRVIFVNIFGGLTLGDMIARGVLLAFKELELKIPVVVRIRGTNEEEGQKIIAESGLPLFAFDDFQEAAEKAIELSRR